MRRTISQMRSWTSLLATLVLFLFMTRETVEMDTPASRAISFNVMSSLLFWGIENRDYPVVMGVTVVIALAVLLTNLLLDLAYGLADPRVRYGRG